MKSALKVLLMLTLLLQGAMASAMSTAMASVSTPGETEHSMPCHDMDGMTDMADMDHMDHAGDASKSCCDGIGHACQAMCAALALPTARYVAPMPATSIVVLSALQPIALAAHRADLLRPPILLSA